MKRHLLHVATMLTIGATSLLFLYPPHWPGLARSAHAARHRHGPAYRQPHEWPGDPTAQRWLRGEPRHWRDCVLQH